jgi:hypothetical protein
VRVVLDHLPDLGLEVAVCAGGPEALQTRVRCYKTDQFFSVEKNC